MKIESLCSFDVIAIDMDDKLEKAKEILDANRFHHLPVVDNNKRLSGIISDRDVLREVSPFIDKLAERTQDLNTLDRRVHQFMTRKVITIEIGSTLAQAVELMLAHDISCLPIVNEDRRVTAIVTTRDILRHAGS